MSDDFGYIMKMLADSNQLLAKECLDKISSGEIHFHRGIFKKKVELTSLYELRWRMAEDLNRDKFKMEELQSWREAVEQLKAGHFHDAQLSTVATQDKTYFLFVNLDEDQLAALFFLYQKKSLEERGTYSQEITQRGYTSSSQRYYKGKLLED